MHTTSGFEAECKLDNESQKITNFYIYLPSSLETGYLLNCYIINNIS